MISGHLCRTVLLSPSRLPAGCWGGPCSASSRCSPSTVSCDQQRRGASGGAICIASHKTSNVDIQACTGSSAWGPENTADARPRRAPTRLGGVRGPGAADACIDLALRSRRSVAAIVDFAGVTTSGAFLRGLAASRRQKPAAHTAWAPRRRRHRTLTLPARYPWSTQTRPMDV